MDADSGEVIDSTQASTPLRIASATKVMTALLARRGLPADRRVPAADYEANPIESKIDLRPGERMRVRDLLYALMLESANDAAVTLAEAVSGSEEAFVDAMNDEADALGLTASSFRNPIGLDEPGHRSSALDLAKMARELRSDALLRRIVDTERRKLRSSRTTRTVDTRNRLLRRFDWVSGVKTGHTQRAGWVLVGSGTQRSVNLISVVLGAPSEQARDEESLKLLRYGFSRYRRRTPVTRDSEVTRRALRHSDEPLALRAASSAPVTVRFGQQIRTRVDAPLVLEGPIAEGEQLGRVEVFVDGEPQAEVGLLAARQVDAPSLVDRLGGWIVVVGAAIVVGAGTVFFRVVRRRRSPPRRPPRRPEPA